MTPINLKAQFDKAHRIVIKIGTETILKNGVVHTPWLNSLAGDIARLKHDNKEVFIVSSGAIGLGRGMLGIDPKTPGKDLPMPIKQKAAMVGQCHLVMAFDKALGTHGLFAGQALLTKYITTSAEQTEKFCNATMAGEFDTDMTRRIVPILNENDVIVTKEIEFGDNDGLGALVANLVDADIYVILSDLDGLYTDNPKLNPDAKHIPYVPNIRESYKYVNDDLNGMSRGGMQSRLLASESATASRYAKTVGIEKKTGSTVILAKGKDEIGCLGKLIDATDPDYLCTIIPPQPLPQNTSSIQRLEA
jgi:glutamate 5-kinase